MNELPSTENLARYLFEEEGILREDFREYFLRKRYNLIATINSLQDITDLFLHIDNEWLKAVKLLSEIHEGNWIVPVQLTIFCFRELRLSGELLLSGCTTPGFSHLRSAVEAFIQAQKIMREPHLGIVWLGRDTDRTEYDKHFKANFKMNLFPESSGFVHLHGLWQMLCDAGPHPNVTSIGLSSSILESESDFMWSLDFFEVNREELAKNLLVMVNASIEMFKFTYTTFHSRLSVDPELPQRLHSHLGRYAQLRVKYSQ